MSDLVGFAGAHAEVYASHILPAQILPFADLVAAWNLPMGRVLDLACGCGFVGSLIPNECVEVDASPGMLGLASHDGVRLAAFAESLPFADQSFDAATCVFGWMFFDDFDRAACELRRVLRPGSPTFSLVWNGLDDNAFPRLARDVVAPFFPNDPPTFYDIAFRAGTHTRVSDTLRRAGFRNVDVEPVERIGAFPNARRYAEAFIYGNVAVQRLARRDQLPLHFLLDALEIAAVAEFGETPTQALLSAQLVTTS